MAEKTEVCVAKSAPWITFYKEIEALFGQDPEITCIYTANPPSMKLYVENPAKADAIDKLLPKDVSFGGVDAPIIVIPGNKPDTKANLFKTAFDGNPAFSRMVSAEGIFTNPIHYCVFNKEVVQFWDDNLGDINGNVSTLYEDLAADIFDDTEGVMFCTESE